MDAPLGHAVSGLIHRMTRPLPLVIFCRTDTFVTRSNSNLDSGTARALRSFLSIRSEQSTRSTHGDAVSFMDEGATD